MSNEMKVHQFQFDQMRSTLELKQSARNKIDTHLGFLCIILFTLFVLQLSIKQDTTLFYDEAVNITVGTEILAGDISKYSTYWTFGSNLFPVIIATTHFIGGLVAVNLLLVLLNFLTAFFIYLVTRDLFSPEAGLWALILFGFSAGSLNLSQLAVYDVLALPLLAMALYFIVKSSGDQVGGLYYYPILIGLFASFAVLSKYIVLLFIPALLIIGVAIYFYRSRNTLFPFSYAGGVFLIITGNYAYRFWVPLMNVLQNQASILQIEASRSAILQSVVWENGIVIVLALLGIVLLASKLIKEASLKDRIMVISFAGGIIVAVFLILIYHLASQNIQSLWKHMIFAYIFLAPLAGYFLSRLSFKFFHRPKNIPYWLKVLSVVGFTALISLYAEYSLALNWGFQQSWPDAGLVVDYLETYPMTADTYILAEQSSVYEYYSNKGGNIQPNWDSTFAFEYAGLSDVEAMVQAVNDKYFDLVILDDYYTIEKNVHIRNALAKTGYVKAYSVPSQVLSSGQSITIDVYSIP